MATRTLCFCDDFAEAKARGEFVWWPHVHAYAAVTVPMRRMSPAARYYASERGNHEDHTGECFSFVDCPFCGHELPGTLPTVLTDPRLAEPDE
jgi:hypothetical protein